jgi:hypothetical protein
MYKCLECGNTYKFVGTVKEEGNAFIYQNSPDQDMDKCKEKEKNEYNNKEKDNDKETDSDKAIMDCLTWAFLTSDGQWKCSHSISRCFYCRSKKIGQI